MPTLTESGVCASTLSSCLQLSMKLTVNISVPIDYRYFCMSDPTQCYDAGSFDYICSLNNA